MKWLCCADKVHICSGPTEIKANIVFGFSEEGCVKTGHCGLRMCGIVVESDIDAR